MRKTLTAVGSVALLALPLVASAVTVDPSLGSELNLGSADLRDTVVKIIQFVLAIMGLLAVALIIYGGFIWMTAAGNEERVDKGKKIISAALVGLIVIILAFAIVLFVSNTATNVTQ